MKTNHSKIKRPVKKLSVIRFTLVIAIIVFAANVVKSQNSTSDSDYKKVDQSSLKKVQPASSEQTKKTIPTEKNMVIIPKNLAEHAPEFNDPDYEAKKIEWMTKYPEEYNAIQQKTSNCSSVQSAGTSKTGTIIPHKVAEHAPDLNDPDYEAKKSEWIKNYPEEYNSIVGSSTGNSVSNQTIPQASTPGQPKAKSHTKIAEHAPYLDDPDYEAKKAIWMKNYPEEMNAVLQQSSNTNKKVQPANNTLIQKPATKVAEHAPYLNDPDYGAKKAEWIKNYPQEYNAVNNKPANSVKNSPTGQGVQTPATAVPVNDATRK